MVKEIKVKVGFHCPKCKDENTPKVTTARGTLLNHVIVKCTYCGYESRPENFIFIN